MTGAKFPPHGRFCVLDIETAPGDEMLAIGDRRGGDLGARTALHSVVAASVLSFERSPTGGFDGFRLRSFDTGAMDEAELILRLDAELAPTHASGGGMVTFNGTAHDLPALERRAARHWLFDAMRYPSWSGARAGKHLDLMRAGVGCASVPGARWPSLLDACAAFGIDASLPPRAETCRVGEAIRKAEVDVVATYVLHLYALSAREGSPGALVAGWPAIAAHLAAPRVRAEHLLPFARHPHVAVARRLVRDGRALG